MYFAVASANEYLIITGLYVSEIKVCKKAFILPGQRCARMSLSPLNYSLSLHAMTMEKLEFTLPAVFTIGPKDDPESILKYARLLCDTSKGIDHIKELVTGIVEGETRVIAAGMTMEEIFKERAFFKDHVMQGIQSEVSQFGMMIYNANVKQLQDAPGSEYFKYLRLKSQEGAINQAKVDVATAKTHGAIGEKKREAEKRMQVIEIESNTVIYEQNRQVDIAKADSTLKTEKTKFENNVAIARIEAAQKASMVEAELQFQLEKKNALVQQERERAEKLSKAIVKAETIKTMADADLYVSQKTAEAFKLNAQAQADGIKLIQEAFKGDNTATMQFLMLEKGLYQDLAKLNADAIKGLQPKISVWTTGGEGSGNDAGKPIRDIFQSLPPLFSTINEQTGITPPSWLANLPIPAAAEGQDPKAFL